jgi:hypothetical protein
MLLGVRLLLMVAIPFGERGGTDVWEVAWCIMNGAFEWVGVVLVVLCGP